MTMTRKEFLGTLATAAAVLALGGAHADAAPSCPENGVDSTGTDISRNHGHELVIPAADVNGASRDRMYSIQGTSAHDHMVTITSAMFDRLKANAGGFKVISTLDDFHTHIVTIRCA